MSLIGKICVAIAALLLLGGTYVSANDEAAKAFEDKSDKTGTNPINFQRDLRIYNEYSWLNTEGDGDQNLTTIEYRQPLAEGKWQFRSRIRYNSLTADINDDGNDDIDDSGMGDTDIRFLTVPYLEGANAFAFAMEFFFDTASEDSLGSGTDSLGPQVFYARFFGSNPLPIYSGGGLFAPGLQYKFSVNEDSGRDDTEQILIDLNFLSMAPSKKLWFFTNPQLVFDQEQNEEFAIVDLEFGWMMTMWFPDMKGHSFYVRPSFSVGVDRPADYGLEVAYKLVGW